MDVLDIRAAAMMEDGDQTCCGTVAKMSARDQGCHHCHHGDQGSNHDGCWVSYSCRHGDAMIGAGDQNCRACTPPAVFIPPASSSDSTKTTTPVSDAGYSSKSSDPSWHNEPSVSYSLASQPSTRKSSAPPKPSFFNRLNFMKKDEKKTTHRPRRRVEPKQRIYKSRLAKEADWDRLPLAQALYHFKGEMKCDLEFRKGQVIQVITRTETQDDWWEGKIDDRVGIFPANYVKLM